MGLESSSLSFPASPTFGQTYDFQGKTYSWNGTGWRQVVPPVVRYDTRPQWIALTAAYTLVSQTAAQDMFPRRMLLASNTTYHFECAGALSSLDTGTDSDFGFALAGSATLSSQAWKSVAANGTAGSPAASKLTWATTAALDLTTVDAAASTAAFVIHGIVRVSTGGTFVSQISLATAAAAVVAANSYLIVRPLGPDTAGIGD